jgi:hypothetical protein
VHAYIEIVRADGRIETRPLEGEQVTLGRGGDAAISIPDAPELEPVHLLLAPRGEEGCWVSVVQGAETVAWVSGKKHENGMLKWGTEIDVGSLSLRINHALVEEQQRRAQRRRWAIIGLLTVLLILGSFLNRKDRDRLPPRPADAPALFADAPPACPDQEREAARLRAENAREEADARVVRYPFDAQDGIAAVDLLHVAVSCLRQAGDGEQADRVAAERERIKAQVEEDYQVHRIRLGRLLREGRRDQALIETQALLALLEHRDGAYRDWLLRLQRHLEIKLEGRKRKK